MHWNPETGRISKSRAAAFGIEVLLGGFVDA